MSKKPMPLSVGSDTSASLPIHSFIFDGEAKYGSPSTIMTMPMTQRKYSIIVLNLHLDGTSCVPGTLFILFAKLLCQSKSGHSSDREIQRITVCVTNDGFGRIFILTRGRSLMLSCATVLSIILKPGLMGKVTENRPCFRGIGKGDRSQ